MSATYVNEGSGSILSHNIFLGGVRIKAHKFFVFTVWPWKLLFIYSLLSQLSFSLPVSRDARHISKQQIHGIKNQKDEYKARRTIRLRIQLCPHLDKTATQTWRCQHWAACQAEDTTVSFKSVRLRKSHVAWAGREKRTSQIF